MLGLCMEKKKGGIEYLSALALLSFTGLVLLFCISIKEVMVDQSKIKDSVDMSALAAAIVDIDKLKDQNTIVIGDAVNARTVFENTLMSNMGYEEESDDITIHEFKVYNMVETAITEYTVDSDNRVATSNYSQDGTKKTPNGKLIEGATIYVDVGMYVNSYIGESVYKHIISSVDVVKNE